MTRAAPDPYHTQASILLRLSESTAQRQMAWQEFYRFYAPIIASFARNLGASPQDAQDVIQDVMLGFYRVSPAGVLTGPMKQVNRPNGIELDNDEMSLYVGDVGNRQIHKLTLAADGTVNTASDQVFVTAKGQTVDGMCTDCAGNLYASTQSGVEVYSMTSAAYIGTVMTGEASNCTFGGTDRRTLYVASRSAIEAVTLNVPGLPD